VLFGLGVLALPLCGANGLASVPALAAWLVYAGISRLRSERPELRTQGRLALAVACISLLLIGLYLVGYRGNPEHPPCPRVEAAIVTITEILSMSLGQATRSLWPVSSLCVLGLCAGLGLALIRRARADQKERLRTLARSARFSVFRDESLHALGLLSVMVGLLCLAVVTGWGRSGFGAGAGFPLRYVTLVCPLLCWCYLVWVVYWPAQQYWAVQALLVVSALAAVVYNAKETLFYARDRVTQVVEVEKDLWSGDSIEQLVKRHGEMLSPHPESRYCQKLWTGVDGVA
jgi:hypothetical protein